MEDIPRELLKSTEQAVDSEVMDNEQSTVPTVDPEVMDNGPADTSMREDDFIDEAPDVGTREPTKSVSEPVATDTRHYPHRTRRPPDRLIQQDIV